MPVFKVAVPVISIGNVVAGGTGKTPFVHLLAKNFSKTKKVAILSRGYGPMPDEPMLLARRLPNVGVYVGKDRVALAKQAVKEGAELIFLDDGFQHRRLHRDLDIVLHGQGKEHYLPWGFLRDSPSRLKTAEVVDTKDTRLVLKRILDLQGREIPSIRGWEVGIFCGIARPERFKKTVEELGAKVVKEVYFADHELADLSLLGEGVWICTEKDFVKLPKTDLAIYFLEMEMQVEGLEKIIEKIGQKIDNSSV